MIGSTEDVLVVHLPNDEHHTNEPHQKGGDAHRSSFSDAFDRKCLRKR